MSLDVSELHIKVKSEELDILKELQVVLQKVNDFYENRENPTVKENQNNGI